MTLETDAKSGIRWTSLSAVSTTAIESFRMVLLALFLLPADFGLMGMVMIVIGFVQAYTDLGISGAIIHRQDSTKQELSSLYWLNVFSGLIAFSVLWLFSPLIAVMFREPRLPALLRVVALVFCISAAGKQFEILLEKELKFDVLAKQDILASVTGFVVAVGCAFYGLGVWALVASVIVTSVLKTTLLLGVGVTRYRPSLHFRRSDVKKYISFGLFQLGERTTNFLSERLDQFLVGTMLGAQALGYYNFAFNLTARPIYSINPIVTRVAFPVLARLQNDTEALKRGYLKLLRLLTTINAPLLLGLAVVAPLAVPVIFGNKWSPAIVLIQILSFVALVRSTGNPIGSLQLAKGRADLGFKWNLILSLVSAPVIFAGGTLGKGAGVGLSLLALQLAMQVPVYVLLIRPLLGKCARAYAGTILKPIGLALVMGVMVAALVNAPVAIPQILRLGAGVAAGAAIYLMLLRLLQSDSLNEFRELVFAR